MRFYNKTGPDNLPCSHPCCSVVLPPRSLLVFADAAYTACLHGIDACDADLLDASVVNPWAAGCDVDGKVNDIAGACGEHSMQMLRRTGVRRSLTFRRAFANKPWLKKS